MKKSLFYLSLITLLIGSESLKAFAAPIGTTSDTRPASPQQRKQWKNQGLTLQVGGNLLGGNVDFQSFNTSLSYNLNINKNQFFIDAGNVFTKAGPNIIANRINASGLYAYNLLDNFNVYAYTTHTSDSSIKLDYRISNGLGVCLHKIASPFFKLFLVSLGGAYENEWYQSNIQENAFRSVLRLNAILPVSDYAELGVDSFYTPVITNFNNYRLYNEAFLQFKIVPDTLSFKLSFADEFYSAPKTGVKNNDYGVFANLSLDIGN
ncbi:MAG: DUF481 domain-containing protein [Candidatus Sericytochromatia bacterium]